MKIDIILPLNFEALKNKPDFIKNLYFNKYHRAICMGVDSKIPDTLEYLPTHMSSTCTIDFSLIETKPNLWSNLSISPRAFVSKANCLARSFTWLDNNNQECIKELTTLKSTNLLVDFSTVFSQKNPLSHPAQVFAEIALPYSVASSNVIGLYDFKNIKEDSFDLLISKINSSGVNKLILTNCPSSFPAPYELLRVNCPTITEVTFYYSHSKIKNDN